jgi:hypothetical protein
MFFGPATLALVALFCFTGVPPSGAAARSVPVAAPRTVAAGTKLWAPKKVDRPRRSDDSNRIAREEELLLRPRNAPAAPPRPRKKIKMETAAATDDEAGGDDDDEDEAPTVSRRHKSSDEEEDDDDDDDEESPSLPSIAPHMLAFGVGTSFTHRSFTYDAPLQGDNGFRLGYALALESYPLLLTGPGWWRNIGIGFRYANEVYGTAGVRDPDDGSLVSYPVKQMRWGIDLRYAIPLGANVVVIPAVGYGKLTVDLRRPEPLVPSMCTAGISPPCFSDVDSSTLNADVHLRVAFMPVLSMSLTAGVSRGLNISRAPGGIAAEVPAVSNGFHVEPGVMLMLGNWFALQASFPIVRNSYDFAKPASGNRVYSSATETYFGVVGGVTALVY